MISIKTNKEIELMTIAGNIVYKTLKYLESHVKEGITTNELDKLAEDFIASKDAKPSFKGYNGFPKSICTSINDQIVHGIPSNYKLKKGDIISIDVGACYKGYHGDSAWTFKVGNVEEKVNYLLEHTKNSLYEGIKQVKPGNRIGDISASIEEYASKYNLGVVKELVGHGIGSNIHEDPDVPNFGRKGTGIILKEGMTIAIEPMLTLGSNEIAILDDEWTIVTIDNSKSAHFEHTVLVTNEGYKILTGE
jgi:methionyl aminopeptidase